jgi:hypothetical protein
VVKGGRWECGDRDGERMKKRMKSKISEVGKGRRGARTVVPSHFHNSRQHQQLHPQSRLTHSTPRPLTTSTARPFSRVRPPNRRWHVAKSLLPAPVALVFASAPAKTQSPCPGPSSPQTCHRQSLVLSVSPHQRFHR